MLTETAKRLAEVGGSGSMGSQYFASAEEPGDWCIGHLFALGFGAVGML